MKIIKFCNIRVTYLHFGNGKLNLLSCVSLLDIIAEKAESTVNFR